MGDDLGDEFYDVPRQSEDDSSDADNGVAQSTKKRSRGSESNDADDFTNEVSSEIAAAKKKKKKKKKPRTEASSGSAIGGASADALAGAFMGLYFKEVCFVSRMTLC